MKLKDFLVKSGGVISSSTYESKGNDRNRKRVSMLVGAVYVLTVIGLSASSIGPTAHAAMSIGKERIEAQCSICNELFELIPEGLNADDQITSYQDVYSVETIKKIHLIDYVYSASPSIPYPEGKEYLQAALFNDEEICLNCLETLIAEYKVREANNLSAPGTGNTPITLTAENSTFDITVPTSIPLVVNEDGTVTAPTGVKIVNDSAGAVKVASIAMNNGDWTLTDYNSGNRSKLAEAKVDSKKLGLSLAVTGNAAVSSKDGSQTPAIDTSKWTMAGGNELPITIGAIATASSEKTTSEVTAANVVFTLAWS